MVGTPLLYRNVERLSNGLLPICTYVQGEARGHYIPPTPPKRGLDKSIYSLYFLPFQGIPDTPLKCSMINSLPLWDFIIYTYVHYYICIYVHMYPFVHISITTYVHMGIYTLLHSYICSYIHNDKCPYVYMYIRALHHSFICRLFYSFICSPCPSLPLSPYTPLKWLLRAL